MVRMCTFPGCENKMTRWTSLSFHRLPLQNREVLRLWLIAMRMDPNIRPQRLRRADHRVCSAHFSADDFCPLEEMKPGQKSQYRILKTGAVPTATEQRSEETTESASSGFSLAVTELSSLPQSTPEKSQHGALEEPSGSRGPFDSALNVLMTSPPQTTTTPKRRSLSGKYYALAPTWSQPLLCIRRWTSLLYHITGVHRWEEGSSEHTCLHPPLSDEEQERGRQQATTKAGELCWSFPYSRQSGD
ncbi:THAP domain-containing protein 1-like [Engraulis encrasicolus]|uniref:THAP domain-containing protein 1-like n=1 Tax=Engraulis encrasicolus TaxID=184585 RepID=UPI002FCEF0B9